MDKATELDLLLSNYQSNIGKIWDLRSQDVYTCWKDEKGDFNAIRDALRSIRPESILDIGYGYGRLAPLYEEILVVVGMDISKRMLNLSELHNKGRNKVKTIIGDIRRMPFEDASFSCIVSVRTLNHIHPNDFTLAEHEITRVCRDAVILLESDVMIPDAKYEFEHDYDRFLKDSFTQTKKELEKDVYLRTYLREKIK